MSVPDGETNDTKKLFCTNAKMFIVLAMTQWTQLRYMKFAAKQLIRDKFLKDEFSESNQIYSTESQNLGQKLN